MIKPTISPIEIDIRKPKNNLHSEIAVPLTNVKSDNKSTIVCPTANGDGRDTFGHISNM
jgi:hypothetical protein